MAFSKTTTFTVAEGHEATYTTSFNPARRATDYRFTCSCGHKIAASNVRVYRVHEKAHYDEVRG